MRSTPPVPNSLLCFGSRTFCFLKFPLEFLQISLEIFSKYYKSSPIYFWNPNFQAICCSSSPFFPSLCFFFSSKKWWCFCMHCTMRGWRNPNVQINKPIFSIGLHLHAALGCLSSSEFMAFTYGVDMNAVPRLKFAWIRWRFSSAWRRCYSSSGSHWICFDSPLSRRISWHSWNSSWTDMIQRAYPGLSG